MTDVYDSLMIDLVKNVGIDMFTARKIVNYLENEGHIDYDALKEHYLYGEEDE